jgi:AcrR family transcriptional regulator
VGEGGGRAHCRSEDYADQASRLAGANHTLGMLAPRQIVATPQGKRLEIEPTAFAVLFGVWTVAGMSHGGGGRAGVGPGRPVAALGEATRAAIVNAAVDVVAKQGWSGLAGRTVARRAGVSPGVLHYHFASIDALEREVAAYAMGAVLMPAAARLLNAESVVEGLEAAVATALGGDRDNRESKVMFVALVRAMHNRGLAVELRGALAQFRDVLELRLAAAQREGMVGAHFSPRGAAMLLAALLDGIVAHHLLDPELDLSAAGPALRSLVHGPSSA